MPRKSPKKDPLHSPTANLRKLGYYKGVDEPKNTDNKKATTGKTFSWKNFDIDKFFKEADSIGREIGYRFKNEPEKDK